MQIQECPTLGVPPKYPGDYLSIKTHGFRVPQYWEKTHLLTFQQHITIEWLAVYPIYPL
jgi:hypothetical protein